MKLLFPLWLVVCMSVQSVFGDFLYQGKDAVPENWWTVGWDGVTADIEPEVAKEDQAASLAILVTENAEPWAGAGLEMNQANPSPVLFNAADWDDLHLEFSVNGGVSPDGERSGGQKVQVQCRFWTDAGEVVEPDDSRAEVPSKWVPIDSHLEAGRVDDDEKTWQKVSIPLGKFSPQVEKQSGVLGLAYFAVQFVGEAPTAGLYITDVAITRAE